MEKPRGRLYVGTSGWSYDWGDFYPADLPDRSRLEYYAGRFGTVEVNYSFYRLPRKTTYEKWAAETPDGFLFALKLSRYISHIKRLHRVKTAFRKFIVRAAPIGGKLGPVLVQLPPSFKLDVERLAAFLEQAVAVGKERGLDPFRLAFEFRHPTWFSEGAQPAIAALGRYGATFVCGHSSRYPYPENEPVTSDFMYLRFHGPEKMFASAYGAEGLKRWEPRIRAWLDNGIDVFAYFNNDAGGHAAPDAQALLDLLDG